MIGLLARAAEAAAKLLGKNSAARKAALDAARKAAEKFKDVGRTAVHNCKAWARNRGIRVVYNANKRLLAKEIDAMRKAGASREEMAKKAFAFRRNERLSARETMRRNGDAASVEKLERRDMEKYGRRGLGDKDGPNFEGLKKDAAKRLRDDLGREPSRDEVFDHIVDSALRTDVKTNLKYLSF